jgi:hypothetical protein
MNACQCELQAMTASKSGVQLKVLSGSKLLNKSLNVPGYQISLEQDQKAGPDVFALSMKPRVGQERNL